MVGWDQFVDLLRAAIIAYSQACGGNVGTGILAVTLLVRMAMFPLTFRLARISAAHQQAMLKLKPELDAIRARFNNDPDRIARETRRLFQREGVSPFSLTGCLGMLIQTPVLLGLFNAARECAAAGGRFLWIRNIAKPDIVLAVAVTALTYATVSISANTTGQNKALLIAVPTIITFFVLFAMPAGVGLYWGLSGLVSLVQTIFARPAFGPGVERGTR